MNNKDNLSQAKKVEDFSLRRDNSGGTGPPHSSNDNVPPPFSPVSTTTSDQDSSSKGFIDGGNSSQSSNFFSNFSQRTEPKEVSSSPFVSSDDGGNFFDNLSKSNLVINFNDSPQTSPFVRTEESQPFPSIGSDTSSKSKFVGDKGVEKKVPFLPREASGGDSRNIPLIPVEKPPYEEKRNIPFIPVGDTEKPPGEKKRNIPFIPVEKPPYEERSIPFIPVDTKQQFEKRDIPVIPVEKPPYDDKRNIPFVPGDKSKPVFEEKKRVIPFIPVDNSEPPFEEKKRNIPFIPVNTSNHTFEEKKRTIPFIPVDDSKHPFEEKKRNIPFIPVNTSNPPFEEKKRTIPFIPVDDSKPPFEEKKRNIPFIPVDDSKPPFEEKKRIIPFIPVDNSKPPFEERKRNIPFIPVDDSKPPFEEKKTTIPFIPVDNSKPPFEDKKKNIPFIPMDNSKPPFKNEKRNPPFQNNPYNQKQYYNIQPDTFGSRGNYMDKEKKSTPFIQNEAYKNRPKIPIIPGDNVQVKPFSPMNQQKRSSFMNPNEGRQQSYYDDVPKQRSFNVRNNRPMSEFYNYSKQPRPIFAFGFGGRILSIFPTKNRSVGEVNILDSMNDDSFPYTAHKNVRVENLKEVIFEEKNILNDLKKFPGPLSNKNKNDVINYINYQIMKYQSSTEDDTNSDNINSTYSKQLWEILRILVHSNTDSNSYDEALENVRNVLLHKSEFDSFANESEKKPNMFKLNIEPIGITRNNLINLEKLLISGEIERACTFAIGKKLWSHALLLSSVVNKEMYQRVVKSFTKECFSYGTPLKTLYLMFVDGKDSLFSDGSSSDIEYSRNDDVIQTSNAMMMLQQKYLDEQNTSDSASYQICENWEENISIILSNITKSSGSFIEKIAEKLWSRLGLIECSHICFILADYFCDHSGFLKILCLIGGDHVNNKRGYINHINIHRTEIFNYIKEQQDRNYLDPYFQIYRLVYCRTLIEYGLTDKAKDYLSQIDHNIERLKGKFIFNSHFLYQLKKVKERLNTFLSNKANTESGGIIGSLFKFMKGGGNDAPVTQTKTSYKKKEKTIKKSESSIAPQRSKSQKKIKRNSSIFGSLFSMLSRSSGEINYGDDNAYVYSEKHAMYIPAGVDPDEYAKKKKIAPPPTEMMNTDIFKNASSFNHMSRSNRYVDAFNTNNEQPNAMMNQPKDQNRLPYQNNQVPPSYQSNQGPPSYQSNQGPPSYQSNQGPPSYQINQGPPYQSDQRNNMNQSNQGPPRFNNQNNQKHFNKSQQQQSYQQPSFGVPFGVNQVSSNQSVTPKKFFVPNSVGSNQSSYVSPSINYLTIPNEVKEEEKNKNRR